MSPAHQLDAIAKARSFASWMMVTGQLIIDAYIARGKPESGRNMASIFHRLRLTLFHAGGLDTHRRPARRAPVSVTGWTVVTAGFAQNARTREAAALLGIPQSTVKTRMTRARAVLRHSLVWAPGLAVLAGTPP